MVIVAWRQEINPIFYGNQCLCTSICLRALEHLENYLVSECVIDICGLEVGDDPGNRKLFCEGLLGCLVGCRPHWLHS